MKKYSCVPAMKAPDENSRACTLRRGLSLIVGNERNTKASARKQYRSTTNHAVRRGSRAELRNRLLIRKRDTKTANTNAPTASMLNANHEGPTEPALNAESKLPAGFASCNLR